MNPWRAAVLAGLLYGLPFALWLLTGLEAGPRPPDLAPAHRALLACQSLALVLMLPALVRAPFPRGAGAAVLLVAVPWPLLPVFLLTGSVPLPALLAGQGALLLLAAALALFWRLAGRAAVPWRRCLRGGLQGLALIGLLAAGVGP